MESTFAWLDYSEQQRRRMLEIVGLFREKGTVDELGIGTVRDAVADTLFPATSVLHTRPRYLFFIPWIYQRIERQRVPSERVPTRLKRDELQLIEALDRGGEQRGVIGIEARKRLQRFPSLSYWAALGVLGIRLFPGTQRQYHRSLDGYHQRMRQAVTSDGGDPAVRLHRNWHAGLPVAPHGVLEETTFDLARDEGEYLQERYLERAPDSTLAYLLGLPPEPLDGEFPWTEPLLTGAPPHIAAGLEHARCFSELLHGAALMYNLLLAERAIASRHVADLDLEIDEDLTDQYRGSLASWTEVVTARRDAYDEWNRVAFWDLVLRRNPRLSPRNQRFVEQWIDLVLARPDAILDDEAARRLVAEREVAVKGGLARLVNLRALERWSGASGADQLTFRWPVARTLANDVFAALRT